MDHSVGDNSNLHDYGIENAVDECSFSKNIHRFYVVKSTELKARIEETEKQIQRKNEDLFSTTVNIDNKKTPSLHYRMLHERKSLVEEKKLLREIKQLEKTREKVVAKAADKGKYQDSLGSEDAIQEQFKLINYLDERKEEQMKVKENIEHLKKEIKVLEKDLSCLQMQQTKLYQRKYEVNARIIDLRKRLDEVIGGARMSSNCKLLDRHGKVVAYAQTERKDRHAHHVRIGLGYSKVDCWEVSVIEPLVENFPLFLRGPVFFTLDDAVGSTIAWPIKHILCG